VGVYVFVFAIKLVAYFMTGVLALLAESVRSLTVSLPKRLTIKHRRTGV
jgi:divalent metal cation (Fe/Co/Zn/Cd) transporter